MNKTDLIAQVASASDLSKADAGKVVNAVFDSITAALSRGEVALIPGFGTFLVNSRNARVGRNPRTGEKINIPARKIPAFRAGKGLKDAVND